MKRILAVFLTLAMALNIAPMAAFAAADSDAAPIVAVEETDENASSQPDEQTARAIASDPFLQAAYAQTEQEQTGRAEVDTSKVSVSATNSFGQLLVNGMEGQNADADGSTNRITNVTMNGRTANVQYVLDGTADLMVAIYTDGTEEEMVASGTTEVSGNADNGAAQVSIVGDIPETYTIKAFLLDKTDHSPLSSAYTDVSHTQVMVDLDKATVNDFPEDRVINLDDQDNTNFAVVNKETTLLTYEDNTAGENQLLSEDDTSLVYTFGNAGAEIRNLQPGDILTYEYAPGELLIARVQDITVNGDIVTIQGDDTLEPTDVFDILKIEEFADSGELVHSDEGMDPAVTYLGVSTGVDAENKFEIKDGAISDNVPIVDNVTHEFALNGTLNDIKDGMLSVTVNGEASLFANIDFAYYIAWNKQWIALSSQVSISGKISVGGAISAKVPLGPLHTPKMLKKIGIEAEITPNIVLELSGQITFKFSYEQRMLLGYSTMGGFQNLSEPAKGKVEPVMDDDKSTSKTISIFAGLEIGPKVQLGDELLWVEFKLKGGVKASAEPLGTGEGVRHECAQCLDFTEKLTGKLTIKLILLKKDLVNVGVPEEINLLDIPIGNWYWSLTFGEVGEGTCPHLTYHVQISVKNHRESGITIYEKLTSGTQMKFVELGKTDENGTLQVYLPTGNHDLTASIGKQNYSGMAMITGSPTEIELSQERTEQPDEPEKSDYTIENGRLTIYNENMMMDYARAEDTPWYGSRDEITYILTQYGVKKISSYAFADCNKVAEVYIGDEITEIGDYAFSGCSSLKKITFVGTMAKWKEIQIGAGNDVLNKVTIICSDGVINASEGENVLVSGKCGENLFWYVTENVELIIVGTGDMYDYGYMNAPWYTVKKASGYTTRIQSVQLSDGMTKIGNHAFMEAPIKEVDIPDSVKVIGTRAFLNCNKLEEVFIPNGVTEIGESSFSGCHNIKNVTGMENIAKIGSGAFEYCSGLTSIEIPDSVMEIEREAFASCTILMDATLPHNEAYTTIASKLFSECENLKTINIPDNVTEIEGNAFEGCSELASVSGMKNVKVIGTHSFWMCKKLVEIHLTDTIEKIGVGAFAGCAQISQVKLPQNTEYTKVNDETFWGCENLTDVDIPNNVTRIGESAFARCEKIKTLLLPLNMTTIGARAFSGCTMLETIEIPRGVTGIGGSAFSECSKLKEVVLPENISGLDTGTFRNSGLVKITLPKTIGNIAPTTFENCAELSDVVFTGTKNEWSKVVIYPYGNDMLQSATIHCTDGDIVPTTENSITGDTSATENGSYQATFSGVEAGKDYVIIVSRSGSDPLSADNLLYINQITADADGELTVPFITAADAEEMTYVVACAQDDATVDPDQPDKPGGDEPSSGDDGGGAAIILIGGVAAVAAVAGVVLMMPVKVEGTVKIADQPVANATVQVLKNGNVAAQTTTDANGHFTVKVKRGGYTLRVQWTDASGQPVMRTVDFKAPDANLNVAA
ncbi:MAG TPA: hypothetical protein DCL93_01620 [Faecalibacterium sp.]|nr:hypothetical protein [Faecalibacterium sp.]